MIPCSFGAVPWNSLEIIVMKGFSNLLHLITMLTVSRCPAFKGIQQPICYVYGESYLNNQVTRGCRHSTRRAVHQRRLRRRHLAVSESMSDLVDPTRSIFLTLELVTIRKQISPALDAAVARVTAQPHRAGTRHNAQRVIAR